MSKIEGRDQGRRRALSLTGMMISFLEQPKAMRITGAEGFATRTVERQGKLLRVTGPERTLVEGFGRPGLAGGKSWLGRS